MNRSLDTTRSLFLPPHEQCAATEIDVSGLSGMSLLEWLGEPAPVCGDAGENHPSCCSA